MLTIRLAALAHDLDMARARMQATINNQIINSEWHELTDEQRAMFLSTAISTGTNIKDIQHAIAT